MTITAHGIVTVHFQQSATRFSQFSSALPSSHRHKKMREAGCYSLSLMGIDRWERISHASLLSKDNQIYLATYTDRAIKIYTIQIQFPKRHHEKSLVCRMLTSTSMACFDDGYYLTQLAWIEQTGCLVVGMASQQETSRLSQYTLETVQTTCTSHLGTVERQQTELKQMDSIEIKTGFISALQSNRNGQLVVGLSDGRVYYQPKEGTLASLLETALMVEPLEEMVVDLVLSPNQTHLIYQLESMTLGVIQLPDTLSLETIEQQLQLCLLNNHDYLDLVSYLIHTYTEDQTDTVLHHVLLKHQQYMPSDMAEWSLAQREKPFGLAMAIYKRIPNRQIQFTHFSRAVQLPLILNCFESSQNEEGQFDISSLWSLVSLSQWIYDYLQWLLREWYLLFHSLPHDLETEHVHAVLLLHPESRQCLVKILRKMEQWIQFCQTSNLIPLDNRLLLQRYTLALVHHDIALSETIGFLEALNSLSCPFEGKIHTQSKNLY
ncbi:hypothetical protein BD560DRAFT_131812 [Blakeslea trispora]|nr:hypothetical protein BD560DRAFT_131812 [Blakeslea trispora]